MCGTITHIQELDDLKLIQTKRESERNQKSEQIKTV